jgi:uncharacterized membrane protein
MQNLLALDLGDTLKITDSPRVINGGVDAGGLSGGVGTIYRDLSSFINLLLPLVFVIAGLILLFLLIGGGFSIIASGGNAKSVEQGKGQIMSAVIGFLVIFSAYWIIQIIQTFTGVQIFNSTL